MSKTEKRNKESKTDDYEEINKKHNKKRKSS